MPTEAAATAGKSRVGFAGDILWLGITAVVLALIMGIVCWPVSAGLSPRLLAGSGPDRPTPSLIPETTVGAPSGTLNVNRLPLPGTPGTTADEVGESNVTSQRAGGSGRGI